VASAKLVQQGIQQAILPAARQCAGTRLVVDPIAGPNNRDHDKSAVGIVVDRTWPYYRADLSACATARSCNQELRRCRNDRTPVLLLDAVSSALSRGW